MIRRYVCGCYNCTDTLADDGEWVLHSDHAAEVAALTAEVESLRDVAREQHEWEEMAEWLGLPMKPDGCKKAMEAIIAERDLLRAECEAWRAVDKLQAEENDTGDEAVGMAEARYTLHQAMAATDAAKALGAEPKGGE